MNYTRFKLALLALLLIISATPTQSQAQRLISYQGVIKDANNLPVTGEHSVTLKIYDTDTGGVAVFQETQQVTLASDGMFNLLIGQTKPWKPLPVATPGSTRYYLGISVDLSPELTPRSPLSDVVSAFFADTAGYARSADTAAFARAVDPASLNIVPTTINGLSHAVKIVGGWNTTVSTTGDTIAISSTGGSGILGLQSIDGSINIFSPYG